METTPAPELNDSLERLINDLIANWLTVFGASIAAGLITFGLSFLMTPVYRVEAILMPTEDAGTPALRAPAGLSGLASIAGINLGGTSSRLSEALAVLNSKAFLAEFISSADVGEALFPERWKSRDQTQTHDTPTMWDATERFRKEILSVSLDKETNQVALSVDWWAPEIAKKWLEGLIDALNASLRTRDIEEAEASLAYLGNRMETAASIELRQTISELMKSQINTIMYANARTDYVLKVIDPPMAPDKDEYVFPNRGLFLIVGALIGGFAAVLFVAFRMRTR